MSNKMKTLVDAGIDIKLTKTDLIDMIVTEQEEELENKLAVASETLATSEDKLDNLMVNYIESYKKDVIDSSKAFVKALVKFTGIDESHLKLKVSFKYNHSLGKEAHKSISRLNSNHGPYKYNCYERPVLVIKRGDYQILFESSKLNGLKKSAKTTKLYKELTLTVDEVAKLRNEFEDLEYQKKNLDKMGKRAKANLVKEMLMSAEQGKEIVASLGKVGKIKLLK